MDMDRTVSLGPVLAESGNGTGTRSSRVARLRLRTAEPRVRVQVHRDIALVEPRLRQLLRDVCRGDKPWPLLLWGPTGTGKTRAALCLLDRLDSGMFATLDQAADALVGRDGSFWGWVRRADVAVLDELGTRATGTDLHYAALRRFLEIREDLPFLGITNLEPSALAKAYDDRVLSRLACGTIYQLGGEDRRFTA